MRNGLIYARVSTDEQAKEGQSIEAQLRICNQYAKDHEIDVISTFVDEGKTATNMNRAGLQDMLATAQDKEKKVDVILVQDTDRLARNTIDHLQIKALLKKNGVQLISTSQPIIDDSPEGNLVDTLLAATNAFQSQITGRKTSKVMEQKALAGWYPGGIPPLGYRNADNPNPSSPLERRIIVQDPTVAPLMKEVFRMYATGKYSTDAIAKFLNEKAVQAPKGGTKIHTSLVVRTLQNVFYIGKFLWNKKEYQGKHEPLIDKTLFDQVQSVMDAHNQGASRKRKHDFLLRGFLFCDICGNRYWGEQHLKGDKLYSFYYCKSCGRGTYCDREILEKNIGNHMTNIEITDEYKKKVLTFAASLVEEIQSTKDSEKLRLEREKAKYEKALREAEDDRYIHHTITAEDFNRASARFSDLLLKSKDSLSKLDVDHSQKLKALERVLVLAENIAGAYALADPTMKREYLGLFFSKFMIKNGKIASYELTPDVKDMIEEGSVRVSKKGMPD